MDGFIKRYRLSLLVVLLMLINEGLTQRQIYTATCSASGGVPKPTLRWYRNNILQKSSTPTSDVTQTLEYAFKAKEGDNNIAFKCVSENSVGAPSVTATISVIWARPFIHPTLTASSPTIVIGSSGSWTCKVDNGYPAPNVYWTLKGNNYFKTDSHVQETIEPAGTLPYNVTSVFTLNPVTSDYNGETLMCRVERKFSLKDDKWDLNTTATLDVHVKPRVSIDPAYSGKNPGEEAKLTCTIQSPLDTTVNWFKTSTTSATLSTNSKYIVSGNTLTVKAVIMSDDDNYYCQARNQAGLSDFSNAVHLIVIPTVSASPTTPEILIGQDVTLTCTVTTKTVATVKWYKTTDTSNPMVAVVNKIELTSNNLVIKSVKTDDIGNYYCQATNVGGSSPNSNVVDLKVYNTPQLVGNMLQSPSVLTNGKNAVFTCNTENGYPEPTITWQLAGSSVSSEVTSEKTLTEFGYQKTSRLTLVASTATHNSKELTCIVSQSKLNTPLTAKTTLAVHFIPTVSASPTTPEILIGQDVTLTCTVTTKTVATVKWYKTPNSSNPMVAVVNKIELTGNNLVIKSVKIGDIGNYYCQATNVGGSSPNSNVVDLKIYNTPQLVGNILQSPSVLTNGKNAVFTCNTENGYPEPTITWQLAGSSVSSGVTSEKTLTEFGYQKTSRLTLVASTATHNSKELTCIVSQSKLNTPLIAKTTLAVHSSPTGIVSLTSPTASTNVGQSATLKCTVSSSLTATVKWRFERSNPITVLDITASSKYVLTASSFSFDTLTITSLDVSDDGNYTCIVTSTAGSSDNTPFSLTVHNSGPPTVSISPSSKSGMLGSDIGLQCMINTRLSTYQVQWYKIKQGGSEKITPKSDKYTLSTYGQSLGILNVVLDDAGGYYCTGTAGGLISANSNTVQITVYSEHGSSILSEVPSCYYCLLALLVFLMPLMVQLVLLSVKRHKGEANVDICYFILHLLPILPMFGWLSFISRLSIDGYSKPKGFTSNLRDKMLINVSTTVGMVFVLIVQFLPWRDMCELGIKFVTCLLIAITCCSFAILVMMLRYFMGCETCGDLKCCCTCETPEASHNSMNIDGPAQHDQEIGLSCFNEDQGTEIGVSSQHYDDIGQIPANDQGIELPVSRGCGYEVLGQRPISSVYERLNHYATVQEPEED